VSDDLTKCPWCGCEAVEFDKRKKHARWGCGSFKHGEEPWQSEACRINELESQVDNLKSDRMVLAMLAADTPQFYNPLHVAAAKQLRDRVLQEPKS
jgi:hypothetical protein